MFIGSSQYSGHAESWNPFFIKGINSAKSLLWEGWVGFLMFCHDWMVRCSWNQQLLQSCGCYEMETIDCSADYLNSSFVRWQQWNFSSFHFPGDFLSNMTACHGWSSSRQPRENGGSSVPSIHRESAGSHEGWHLHTLVALDSEAVVQFFKEATDRGWQGINQKEEQFAPLWNLWLRGAKRHYLGRDFRS